MLHAATIVVTLTHTDAHIGEIKERERASERLREHTAAGRKYWDVFVAILGFTTH